MSTRAPIRALVRVVQVRSVSLSLSLSLSLGLAIAIAATDEAPIQSLVRALTDPSYKVRVQAALILGKLADKRASPALIRALLTDERDSVRGVAAASLGRIADAASANALQAALSDPSFFVRKQARQSLELSATGWVPTPKAGAKVFLAVGFQKGEIDSRYLNPFRRALVARLGRIPAVTMAVAGAEKNGAEPSARQLDQNHLAGILIDGKISRLSATPTLAKAGTPASGQAQIDCELNGSVASYDTKAVRTQLKKTESVQADGSEDSESESKHDCLSALADSVGDDVEKYLKTVETP